MRKKQQKAREVGGQREREAYRKIDRQNEI